MRAAANTLLPYAENPPDGIIGTDDIAFADFGPIFGGVPASKAIVYVREHYHPHAVETLWQRRYVLRFNDI